MLVDVEMEKARRSLLDLVVPLPEEAVSLEEADGRILSRDWAAPADLPSGDQSAVDGYALGGGEGRYYVLRADSPLGPGEAAAVATGGLVPRGTAAVIAREYVRVADGRIQAQTAVEPGRNLKPAGEDFRAGEPVARAGTRVDPGLVAVLAAFGRGGVYVRRRPRVGILSLGRDIVSFRDTPAPERRRDANGPLLAALAAREGALPTGPEVVGAAGLRQARVQLESMLERADVVLTVGGVASGPDDYALTLLREAGARVLFRGVNIKPGHHTGAAIVDDRPLIALSGNPAACAVGYQLLAAPVLRALQGLEPCPPPLAATMSDPYPKKGGPRRFLRGRASCGPQGLRVGLLPGQKSSMLRSLLNWNVLVELPAGHEPVEAGDRVTVIPVDTARVW